MNILVSVAAATFALACPALAAAADVQDRTPVTARVAYTGRDLSSAAGRSRLDARLDRAIAEACSVALHHSRLRFYDRDCHATMMRDARTQVAQRAGATRLASR